MNKEKKAIKKVVDAILTASMEEDTSSLYQVLQETDLIEPDILFYKLLYPIEKAIENRVYALLSETHKGVAFDCASYSGVLFMQHNSLLSLFSKWFENEEGRACCTDKANKVLSDLERYYIKGKDFDPNWSNPQGEYTYHIPKQLTFPSAIEMFENWRRNQFNLKMFDKFV